MGTLLNNVLDSPAVEPLCVHLDDVCHGPARPDLGGLVPHSAGSRHRQRIREQPDYVSLPSTFSILLRRSLDFLASLPASLRSALTLSQRGRMQRWRAQPEEIASLRFDLQADLTPLLNSYNTKQLFLYLTASYDDEASGDAHEVVLWDRILTRSDMRDFRTVGNAVARKNRSHRSKVRIEDVKNKYIWRNPSRSFK